MAGYALRMILELLASTFLVNLTLGLLVLAVAPRIERLSRRISAGSAAHLVFMLRLLPAGSSLFVGIAICIPSYLRFEPRSNAEDVGVLCVVTAAGGAALWLGSILRTLLAARRLSRFYLGCRRRLLEQTQSVHEPVRWLIQSREPVIACSGILRPKLIISDRLSRLLPPEEMQLAVEHEKAHVRSRDNLKRLLVLLAPDVLPLTRQMRGIEQRWAALAEWAADDRAVDGDPRRALTLAAALLRVAGSRGNPPQRVAIDPLVSSFALYSPDFSGRVDRLLHAPTQPQKTLRISPAVAIIVTAALFAGFAVSGLNSATLQTAHNWLELLIR